jgi:succinate-semialdehyde dehydrogenase
MKNKGKARVIWNNLKGKKVARRHWRGRGEPIWCTWPSPWAWSAAVTPVTNPVVTPMCNAMFALKTGNAVIFAPHPKAEKLSRQLLTDEFMKDREGQWRTGQFGAGGAEGLD